MQFINWRTFQFLEIKCRKIPSTHKIESKRSCQTISAHFLLNLLGLLTNNLYLPFKTANASLTNKRIKKKAIIHTCDCKNRCLFTRSCHIWKIYRFELWQCVLNVNRVCLSVCGCVCIYKHLYISTQCWTHTHLYVVCQMNGSGLLTAISIVFVSILVKPIFPVNCELFDLFITELNKNDANLESNSSPTTASK